MRFLTYYAYLDYSPDTGQFYFSFPLLRHAPLLYSFTVTFTFQYTLHEGVRGFSQFHLNNGKREIPKRS